MAASRSMKGFLPDQTRLSQVHLRTARLERALEFYSGVLGLRASQGSESQLAFTARPAGDALLVFTQDRNASARPPHSTGLYHFALRYPTRNDLARAIRRLIEAAYPIDGASEHGVSEAVYLTDPDGNGVELYADRPRSQWRWENGQVAMMTAPLDLDNLLDPRATKGTAETNASPQLDLGHIHLQVADLSAAERFYSEFLGLAVTQRSYPGALFFAAGNYHHHIGVNVWRGNAAPPSNSVGLVSYRLEVPMREVLYCLRHRAPLLGYETRMGLPEEASSVLQIRDPNGNWLEIHASQSATIRSRRPDQYLRQGRAHA
jgi:catechol 2,3-dioxygenase